MNKPSKSFSQSLRSFALSGLLTLLVGSPAGLTIAADLSDVPLFVAVNVPPNVFFELDNSGSMDWEILTTKHWHFCSYDSNAAGAAGNGDCGWEVDNGLWRSQANGFRYFEFIYDNNDNAYATGCDNNREALYECDNNINNTPYQHDWRILSADMNVTYYNPAQTYEPWAGPCLSNGGNCTNASFTNARSNPRQGTAGYSITRNLAGTVYEVWNDDKGFSGIRPQRGTNTNITDGPNGMVDLWDSHTKYTVNADAITVDTTTYNPDNAGLNPTTTTSTLSDTSACYTQLGGGNTSCRTIAQAQQNIANWYQYSRKRAYVAKGAIAKVVSDTPNYRYGLQLINTNNIMTQMPAAATTDYASHNRQLLENLFDYEWQTLGTRLRQGLENAGQYYDATDSAYNSLTNPIIHQCQKCFTILITDGYWNGGDPGIGDSDGDGINRTLADVASFYYKKDLDTNLPNTVMADDFDGADYQHMVTFTVAFGVEGNLVDTDSDGWPDPALSENGNWGDPFCSNCPEKIDDMWHAAYNSRGTFISAKTPQDVVNSLQAALKNIEMRNISATPVALSSGFIGSDTKMFQAKFDSVDWHGTLLALELDSLGNAGAEVWEASSELPAHGSRNILTHNGSNAVRFEWTCGGSTNLSTAQQVALNTNFLGVNDGLGCERLNYLRGDASEESRNGGSFRNRINGLLGDIVNSQPAYVGQPKLRYPDNFEAQPYLSFKQATRDPMIYIGANDGMLHAFDARTGRERMAYIPSMVFKNLSALSSPDYTHRFFVDGSPTVSDAFFGGAWRTVLVGGLNKGGQGIYALDITNPNSLGTSSLLWEFSDVDDSDLGYTYSRPAIAKMNNGSWVAIFGNGYNNTEADGNASTTGNAVLYIVDISSGSLLKKIDTGTGSTSLPNGLSSPALLDVNGDNKVDIIYAGDLRGNLWKFDVSSQNANSWGLAFSSSPLYTALDDSSNPQPITIRPNIGYGPMGRNWMITFGTGSYLGTSDVINTQVQSIYGIVDAGQPVSGRSVLLEQEIVDQGVESFCDENGSCRSVEVRETTNRTLEPSHKGWYLDLIDTGERIVNNMVLRWDRLIFVTTVPEQNSCSGGGSSWLMELSPISGSRLSFVPFDMNEDGEFDNLDKIGENSSPSGRRIADDPNSGLTSTPTVAVCDGGDKDCLINTTTGGQGDSIANNSPFSRGRQSWQQLQ